MEKEAEKTNTPQEISEEERKIVMEVLEVDEEYLGKCTLSRDEDGDILVRSPRVSWRMLAGREWKVDTKEKTCRITCMS